MIRSKHAIYILTLASNKSEKKLIDPDKINVQNKIDIIHFLSNVLLLTFFL